MSVPQSTEYATNGLCSPGGPGQDPCLPAGRELATPHACNSVSRSFLPIPLFQYFSLLRALSLSGIPSEYTSFHGQRLFVYFIVPKLCSCSLRSKLSVIPV